MAYTSANMGLKIWNLITDLFSHSDLASNLATIDTHDHSNGKGVQIPGAGLANNSVTGGKIAGTSINQNNLVPGAGFLQVVKPLGSAFTAAPGQLVLTSGGSTITLPSPFAAANQLVGVYALAASAASPVAITVGSGVIEGPGSAGAGVGSIILGSAGAGTVFQSDGSGAWTIIAGAPDSGWNALPLQAGYAAGAGGGAPGVARAEWRNVGGIVTFAGGVVNTTGSSQSDNVQFANMGSFLRFPTGVVVLTTSLGAPAPTSLAAVELQFNSSAILARFAGSWASGAQLNLDGLSYSLNS